MDEQLSKLPKSELIDIIQENRDKISNLEIKLEGRLSVLNDFYLMIEQLNSTDYFQLYQENQALKLECETLKNRLEWEGSDVLKDQEIARLKNTIVHLVSRNSE